MSSTLSFDTLAYTKKLIAAGFTQQQAEVRAEALKEVIDENLATKRDLKELEYRLTIRVGAMIASSIAITVSLIRLL